MANTYTQIHIQAVFVVKNRECIIQKDWKEKLYSYMNGIITKNGHKVLAINGMPDHVHLFFGMKPTQSIADLMQDVKSGSSKWINDNKLVKGKFLWQVGYGAFSYCNSEVEVVMKYVQNQERHHSKKSFLQEYQDFLEAFEVQYDERYVFEEVAYNENDFRL